MSNTIKIYKEDQVLSNTIKIYKEYQVLSNTIKIYKGDYVLSNTIKVYKGDLVLSNTVYNMGWFFIVCVTTYVFCAQTESHFVYLYQVYYIIVIDISKVTQLSADFTLSRVLKVVPV